MERIILLLQGGAALGAYQCGAFTVIADYLRRHRAQLDTIAGASIGAINGAVIARHADSPQQAAAQLSELWRQTLAQPSWVFSPLPWHSTANGMLTGMLLGHPALFRPALTQGLDLLLGRVAPYRSEPMLETLQQLLGDYRGGTQGPRLLVRTVELLPPRPTLFDSREDAITPSILVASASIPLAFPLHEVQGRYFCDGEFWPQGLLDTVRPRLQLDGDSDYHLISIELYRSEPGLERLLAPAAESAAPDDALERARRSGRLRVTRIRRRLSLNDWLLRPVFDWAPARIERLIRRGHDDALAALG